MIRKHPGVFTVLSILVIGFGVYALMLEYNHYWREPSEIGPHPHDIIPGGIGDILAQYIEVGTGKYDTGYAVGTIENAHNKNFAYAYAIAKVKSSAPRILPYTNSSLTAARNSGFLSI